MGEFKGKVNVNLREYFQKDSDWLPTKKGLTLNAEQWELLKKLAPKIDAAIQKLSK